MISQTTSRYGSKGKPRARKITAWFSRWPILLYRLRLGWTMGHHFMLVTHHGRRSGMLRQTGVMVLRFDPATREVIVAAGSRTADWYRNIQCAPAIQVDIGGQRYRPAQRFLGADEIADALTWSRRHHPVFAWVQGKFFGWPWGTQDSTIDGIARSLGGVAFRPLE